MGNCLASITHDHDDPNIKRAKAKFMVKALHNNTNCMIILNKWLLRWPPISISKFCTMRCEFWVSKYINNNTYDKDCWRALLLYSVMYDTTILDAVNLSYFDADINQSAKEHFIYCTNYKTQIIYKLPVWLFFAPPNLLKDESLTKGIDHMSLNNMNRIYELNIELLDFLYGSIEKNIYQDIHGGLRNNHNYYGNYDSYI